MLLPHVAFWHLVDTPCRLSRPQGNVLAAPRGCPTWLPHAAVPHAAAHGLGWKLLCPLGDTDRPQPLCPASPCLRG